MYQSTEKVTVLISIECKIPKDCDVKLIFDYYETYQFQVMPLELTGSSQQNSVTN